MWRRLAALTAAIGVTWVVTRLLLNCFFFGTRSPPGPPLARFSDLWRFIDACLGQHHYTAVKLHERYGPVVRIGPNAVSASDPRAIETVLGLKSNLDKTDSVRPMQNPYRGEVMPMLISAIDSKSHARIKRPIAGSYSMTTALSLESIADETLQKLVAKLQDFEPDQSCRISQWISFFSFDFILQATFSRDFGFVSAGKDLKNLLAMLDIQLYYISIMGAMPWLDKLLLKNPLLLYFLKIPNPLVDFASECVRARLSESMSQRSAPRNPDFLTYFVNSQKQYPDVVTDLQLITYATTNVLAGSDTTAAALTSIIYYVVKHKRVHDKLLTELDGSNSAYPLSYAEAQSLSYLNAVIKEILRIHPTAGIELERQVGADGLVLPTGHRLPPGATVGINAWPVHRDKEIFGDDAHEFVPERWLKNNGETETDWEERVRRMERCDLAFGRGPRGCLGKNVATLLLGKVVGTLIGTFDVSCTQLLGEWRVLTIRCR
jgi:cytochrome P450